MAKEKEAKAQSPEEIEAKLISAKEKLQAAKDDFLGFCKANGIKKTEDASNHEDEKLAKKWTKVHQAMQEAATRVEKYQDLLKASKKLNREPMPAKYSYPKDVTSGEDKKKYRQLIRSKSKKLGITVDEYLADTKKNDAAYAALPVKARGGNIQAALAAKKKKAAEAAENSGASKKEDTKKSKKASEEPKKEEKPKKKKKAAAESSED